MYMVEINLPECDNYIIADVKFDCILFLLLSKRSMSSPVYKLDFEVAE